MNVAPLILQIYREARAEPFVWGGADCLDFAGRVAQAITGRNPANHLKGTYNSPLSARRVMKENGWETMGDVAASLYEEIPVADARAGDWAEILNGDGSETIGVFSGSMIGAKTELGVGQVPRSRARRAFRVA